ncbi:MAG: hypothetical protein FWE27_02340 [Defluviitaleaceae bacterium]|nr:hypothetical protein [Defluviitaleaceae bacterium]
MALLKKPKKKKVNETASIVNASAALRVRSAMSGGRFSWHFKANYIYSPSYDNFNHPTQI